MCGIAGEFSFDKPVDPYVVKLMTDALVHRGPDDEGIFCDGQIGLGHRRLSIIDLTASGHQPMWSMDKSLAIVFNGEVYNYREIRPELEAAGYIFNGGSDTEVVLNAIHYWGLDKALKKFIGMFAFGLWQSNERKLFLVRDRLGIKPLYFQKTSKHLIFGSELKALYAHPACQRELLPKGLAQYFCFGFTLGESTVYKDTFKIPAGHYLTVSGNGSFKLTRYWSLTDVNRNFTGSFEDSADQLIELCDSAFGYRLVSDVPVGVFLSGGIDSSFLAAFLNKRLDSNLQHITIGFNNPAYNEAPQAAQIAKALGLRHYVKIIDEVEAKEALHRFVNIWDEPFGDTSGIPTSILCGLARQQVKVALSADGGDELFCGYESYPVYDSLYRKLQRVPKSARHFIAQTLEHTPYRQLLSASASIRSGTRANFQKIARFEKSINLLRSDGPSSLMRVMAEKGWSMSSVGELLGMNVGNFLEGTAIEASPRLSGDSNLMDHMMRTDLSVFLGEDILTKVDRASMAFSLECRDPFLDHRLVEFAFSLPMDFLYRERVHKRILKHIAKKWIPPEILSLPKKGFSIPLYDWLRGPWKELVYEYLSRERVRRVGVLNENVVSNEVECFYRYKGYRAEKIMLMLNFQMWAERWHIN